ncbi:MULTISPECIES: phage terminase large subunit [unclassified Minwuia]|uniref:phage terminase large subunit n=1 Tax=unclassified Minwuia TaxID=2618799 RepID=UPI00247AF32F|nr:MULTISPECIES: phage terminase large subunit [unclassified Minwuia]
MNERHVLEALLRKDLNAFVHKCFNTVSPGTPFMANWHIEAITYELGRCFELDGGRLVITQPPRSLKSICSSVAFVAWALGHNPALRFICVSYSNELSEELARQFRLVVESGWYVRLFPAMKHARATATDYVTPKGGGRLATSVGGTLTGRGADIIIIDDPMKANDAQSEVARRKVNSWYAETLSTRLNDKRKGSIILVMQRLHEDDLAGYVLEGGGWRHLDLPAIAIEDQQIPIGPAPDDIKYRGEGDLLHPEREPEEALERLRVELGSLAFSAQYQQRPVPLEGNLVRRHWFRWYQQTPGSGELRRIVQSWDIAGTTGERRDYSVCTTWQVDGRNCYLLDAWRGRLEYPDLRRKVIALRGQHAAQTILIEKAGLGLNLVQDLQRERPDDLPRPIGIDPRGDKADRMAAASARIEAGEVLLPEEAPWLDTFLNELLAFPNGRHDDQVDSVSQFLNWERKRQDDIPLNAIVETIPNPINSLLGHHRW